MTITRAVRSNGHNNDTTNSTTCQTTLTSNSAGNLVVVGVGWVDSGSVTASVADDKGNTFTAIGSKVRQSGIPFSTQMFYCSGVVASAGTVTYTATLSSSQQFTDIAVTESSSDQGLWTPGTGLDTAFTGGTGTGTALSTTAHTPTQNNCMICTYGAANSAALTAGSGFTLRYSHANGTGFADLVQTTAASKAGLLTAPSSAPWTISAAAFKDAPVASGDGGGFFVFF